MFHHFHTIYGKDKQLINPLIAWRYSFNKGVKFMPFTIFGFDLTVTILNIPFNAEYSITIGKEHKGKHHHDHHHLPVKA